jgi:hypothetical protein
MIPDNVRTRRAERRQGQGALRRSEHLRPADLTAYPNVHHQKELLVQRSTGREQRFGKAELLRPRRRQRVPRCRSAALGTQMYKQADRS